MRQRSALRWPLFLVQTITRFNRHITRFNRHITRFNRHITRLNRQYNQIQPVPLFKTPEGVVIGFQNLQNFHIGLLKFLHSQFSSKYRFLHKKFFLPAVDQEWEIYQHLARECLCYRTLLALLALTSKKVQTGLVFVGQFVNRTHTRLS